MAIVNCREIKRQIELEGPHRVCSWIKEGFANQHENKGRGNGNWGLRTSDFTSLRALFEATVENGTELLRAMEPRNGGMHLYEAGNAVDTGTFSNITGQIIYNKLLEAFEDPQLIQDELCTTIPTAFLSGERIAGIGRIGDMEEIVDEGQPYPLAGLNEEYVDTQPTQRRGMIVGVTDQMIVADRTGLLMQRAGEVGQWCAINKEKRVIDTATGTANNTYKRNGTTSNTFLTSGAYVNSQSNPLQSGDYTSVETAELLLDAITDPNTGEPIMCIADSVLVPSALIYTARRLLHATEVRANDGAGNTFLTVSANPLATPKDGNPPYKILSNRWVKSRTGSATTWWLGNFKKAFGYMQVRPIEVTQAPANSEAAFVSDIAMRFKVREHGVVAVLEPRVVVKNT